MNNEVVSGKPQKISYSDRLKLAIVTLVHHRFGSRIEAHLPVSRLRLCYLLYLADLEYYRQHGETYLGNWVYANNGPFLSEIGSSLQELDGLEIIAEGSKNLTQYRPGPHNRFTNWNLDPIFSRILIETKLQCYFITVGAIKRIVYATLPMQDICLGDNLFGNSYSRK